jgi:hypothetical protein
MRYTPNKPIDDVADIWSPAEGSFDEVESAFVRGEITAAEYDALAAGYEGA